MLGQLVTPASAEKCCVYVPAAREQEPDEPPPPPLTVDPPHATRTRPSDKPRASRIACMPSLIAPCPRFQQYQALRRPEAIRSRRCACQRTSHGASTRPS